MVYVYRQNNSGGYYRDPAKYIVVVDANDSDEALGIAHKAGLYLYGCVTGVDCSCCGDRWHDNPYEFNTHIEAIEYCTKYTYNDSDDSVKNYIVTDDLDYD